MPKLKETTKPKGINRVHINPRTKKKEFKCSYRYVGLDGKTHQTETPWCETPQEALQAKKEAFVFARKNSRGRNKKRKLLRKGHLEMPLKSLSKILNGKQIRPTIKNKLLENVHFIVMREQF